MLAPIGHVLKPIIYRVVIAVLLAAGFVFSLARADGPNGDDMTLNVFLDEARLVKLPDRVATERETYNCAPKCERRIAPDDNQQYFNQTLTQTTVRNSQAAGIGSR